MCFGGVGGKRLREICKLAYLCGMKKNYIILACLFISLQVWGQDEGISQKSVTSIHQYFVKHSLCSSELIKVAQDSVFSTAFKQHNNISRKAYFLVMKKASIMPLSPETIQLLEQASQTSTKKTGTWVLPLPNTYGSVWVNTPTISTKENSNMLKILKKYKKQEFISKKELKKVKNRLRSLNILHISMLFNVIIDKLDKDK